MRCLENADQRIGVCEIGLESRPLLTALSCSITCFFLLLLLRGKTWCNKYVACRIVCSLSISMSCRFR